MPVAQRGERALLECSAPSGRTLGRFIVALVCWGIGLPASAQIVISPDITVDIDGIVVEDHQIFSEMLAAASSLISLPPEAELSGYDSDGAALYFSVDITSVVEGVTIEPRDVAKWDGSSLSLEIDGDAEGIPNGARVDAVVFAAPDSLFISLDTSATIGGLEVDDEDLFRVATPLMLFDGEQHGIDSGLDLNGAVLISPDFLLLSFDAGGIVDGIEFEDEDLVAFNLQSEEFALASDGTEISPNLSAIDLTAVPEPGISAMLAGAILAMVGREVHRRNGGS